MRCGTLTIACRTLSNLFPFALAQLAHNLHGYPYSQHARRYLLTLAHQRASADNCALANLSMRQNNCLHADEHMVRDRCTMHDGVMSNGTFLSNHQRRIRIGMQGTVILDIATPPDNYRGRVTPHDRVIPDAGPLVNSNIANN